LKKIFSARLGVKQQLQQLQQLQGDISLIISSLTQLQQTKNELPITTKIHKNYKK